MVGIFSVTPLSKIYKIYEQSPQISDKTDSVTDFIRKNWTAKWCWFCSVQVDKKTKFNHINEIEFLEPIFIMSRDLALILSLNFYGVMEFLP